MKQFVILAAVCGFVASGRLDSQYLPPNKQGNYQGGSGAAGGYSGAGTSAGGYSGGAGGSGGGYSGGAGGGYSGGSGKQLQGGVGGSFERGPNADIPILRLDSQNEGDGNYQYGFETGNGIQATQQGNAQEGAGTVSQGSYSYTSPEGEQIQINYQAGENGFQASGSHIPTAPPVPEEIRKAIEQNLADEARGIVDDGQYRPDEHQGGGLAFQQQGGYQQKSQGGFQKQSNQYIPPSSGQRQDGYKY